MAPTKTKDAPRGTINGNVQSGLVNYTIRARPLPEEVTAFLSSNIESLKRVVQREREIFNSEDASAMEDRTDDQAINSGEGSVTTVQLAPAEFWKQLDALFNKAGKEWAGVSSKIWAFGPRRIGPNILVDDLPDSTRSLQRRSQAQKLNSSNATPARALSPAPHGTSEENVVDLPSSTTERTSGEDTSFNVRVFDESLDTAFQLTTLRGPLCNEPVQGMAYFVEKLEVNQEAEGAEARKFSRPSGRCEAFGLSIQESADGHLSGSGSASLPTLSASTNAILASHWKLDLVCARRFQARSTGLVTASPTRHVLVRHPSLE